MGGLAQVPDVVELRVLSFLDAIALARCEVVTPRWHELAVDVLWAECCSAVIDCAAIMGVVGEWKRLYASVVESQHLEIKLCKAMASSQDHPAESAARTLVDSPCADPHIIERLDPERLSFLLETGLNKRQVAQLLCGCCKGSRPCYWSSLPCSRPSGFERLSYVLAPRRAALVARAVEFAVYTAHWHPFEPNYCPEMARATFATRRGAEPTTVTDWIKVFSVDTPQTIVLDRPVLCVGGGCFTLEFMGRRQRGTLADVVGGTDFYVCISRVTLVGDQIPWNHAPRVWVQAHGDDARPTPARTLTVAASPADGSDQDDARTWLKPCPA